MSEYRVTIGLETHIQLNTKTKAFCSCSIPTAEDAPNAHICPVCTGQPGALPTVNRAMVEKALRLCHAIHADISRVSWFDRKNYLYADMPSGYQITQNERPIGRGGYLDFVGPDGNVLRVGIDNLHMEDDAGKTKNTDGIRLIDMNRCGVPLLELVTRPELHSADEAACYLQALRQLIRWLDISEGNMEKAQLRCDANVSVAPVEDEHFGAKCEIKNINSIEAVRAAIAAEVARQIREKEAGHEVEQWTIEWDNEARELRKMRSKENAPDYRYFREPNLKDVLIDEAWLARVREEMPELPADRRARFISQYSVGGHDASLLTATKDIADYFESLVMAYNGKIRRSVNWMENEILRLINSTGMFADQLRITPQYLAEIMRMVDEKLVNTSTGKALVDRVEQSGKSPAEIVKEQNLGRMQDDSALREICARAVMENPEEAAAYRGGKETLIDWFTGKVMRETRGKADPVKAAEILKEYLKREEQ